MSLKFTRVHAFTADRFAGNPAAVFEGDLPSVETRQKLATEASVPNTAFITAGETPGVYTIDYYSQTARILLCGHASLAAARVLFDTHCKSLSKVQFKTAMAGDVVGTKEEDGRISIDFPASAEGALDSLLETDYGTKVLAAVLDSELSIKAADVLSIIKSVRGPVVELSSEVDLKSLRPDVSGFPAISDQMVIFTQAAPAGADSNIRSRVFCPALGSDEDPVCGSAHCSVVPYFLSNPSAASRLQSKKGDRTLVVWHDSPRGGFIEATWNEETGRMRLTGESVVVYSGVAYL